MPKKNLVGQKFGRLTIIREALPQEITATKRATYWFCQCECGNTKVVRSDALTSGSVQSCGCYNKERTHALQVKNEVGNRYGKLTVIREATPEERATKGKSRHIYWFCQCDCGKTTIVESSHLRNGNTKSCGCMERKGNIKDITGQRFHYWTALEPTERRHEGSVIWKCRCDCGRIGEVSLQNLNSGRSKSCGCKGSSFMEAYFADLLMEKGIHHEREYTFEDLSDVNPLRFDYALYLNDKMILVELDGEQHQKDFKPTERFTREKLDLLHKHDDMKDKYCLQHGIKLYRLPYTRSEDKIVSFLDNILRENQITGSLRP